MSNRRYNPESDPDYHAPAVNGWLVIVLIGLVAVLLFRNLTDAWNNRHDYTQRTVTPRGELASDEAARTELFAKVSPSVVYVRMKSAGEPQTERRPGLDRTWVPEPASSGMRMATSSRICTFVRDALLRQGAAMEVQLGDASSTTARRCLPRNSWGPFPSMTSPC